MRPAPLIYVSAAPADARFAAWLCQQLSTRGLVPVVTGYHPHPLAAVDQCAALFLVASPAGLSAPHIAVEYRRALELGKPVIPPVMRPRTTLPPDLQPLQWVDFSATPDAGWRSVLLVLHNLGLALHPSRPQPVLDPDLALALAYTGWVPASWEVYRPFVKGKRARLREQRTSWALLALATIAALTVSHGNLVMALIGIGLAAAGLRFYPRRLEYRREDDILVLTPEEVIKRVGNTITTIAYTDIASIQVQPNRVAGSFTLRCWHRSPHPPTSLVIEANYMLPPAIADHIVRGHQASLTHGHSGPDTITARPTVFISYARRDDVTADLVEANLAARGLRPWMDRSMLAGGQQWQEQLQAAIDACAALVVVLTRHSLASPAVSQEYTYALQQGKPVIVLRERSVRRRLAKLQACPAVTLDDSLIISMIHLAGVLADAGIVPLGDFGLYAIDIQLMMARALYGQLPPESQMYRSRLPFRTVIANVVIWVDLIVLVPLHAWLFPTFLSFDIGLAALFLAGIGYPIAMGTVRRLRRPEHIVLLPEGVVSNDSNLNVLAYAHFQSISTHITPLGAVLRFTPQGGYAIKYHVFIGRRYRQYAAIARQIEAGFNRYHAQVGNPPSSSGHDGS